MNFKCPHCQQHLDAEKDMEGQPIPCPACGRNILVPLSASAVTNAAMFHPDIPRPQPAPVPAIQLTRVPGEPGRVVLTGIDMSIGQLMILFFKCAIAWMPVVLCLGGIVMILFLLGMGGCAAIMGAAISESLKGLPHP